MAAISYPATENSTIRTVILPLLLFTGNVFAAPPTGPVPTPVGCPAPAGDATERWSGQARWEAIEQAGYRLGEMRIEVLDVYVAEDLKWYQSLANGIHIESREDAVADLLTVNSGDRVEARAIYEAERVLRGLEYLKDAAIHPVRCTDGRVDVVVRARDAWTLKFYIGAGTAGGESTSEIGLQERNFLGTGKGISFSRSEDLTRTETSFGYDDPALFGSEITFSYEYRNLSDGKGNRYHLEKPFRRLDQDLAFIVAAEDTTQELEFFNAGETAYRAQQSIRSSRYEVRQLFDLDVDAGWRGGLGWERDLMEFSNVVADNPALRPSPNLAGRDIQGPYLALERFNDEFASFRNLRAMEQSEDYNLGFVGRLQLGRFEERNSNTRGEFGRIWIQNGTEFGDYGLVQYRAEMSGRHRDTPGGKRWEAAYVDFDINAYYSTKGRSTWVLHLEMDSRERADPEDELYLGGIDGMYGYPQHFRVGDQRWIFHAEHRYVTDMVLFDTLKIGYTAFAEAGRIRGLDGDWSRQFADVGIGLRIGNLRSAFADTYYLAIVTPMTRDAGVESYQIVAGNVIEF
ncbi:MAG: hypothetical protein R3270_11300 [Gammaproteobacteria bacterium]|nr:hypothetical protein [Gammaproteobacteria bacterium]